MSRNFIAIIDGGSGELRTVVSPDQYHGDTTTSTTADQYPRFTEQPQTPGPKDEMLPGWQGEALAAGIILAPILTVYGVWAYIASRSEE